MPTSVELAAIAQQIKIAQDQALQLGKFTSQYAGFDTASAYAVMDRVHAMRLAEGARAVGRKIGFTNPAMWQQYGVAAPIWGYVYDTTVSYLTDTPGTAVCSLARCVNPKIEPEIVFGLHTTPPPNADMAAVLGCIEWVAHGFEMVQSPYPSWSFQAADAIAVGALHARLLVGQRQPVNSLGANLPEALELFTLALSCDGQRLDTGKGANVLGHPLQAVVHLMHVLSGQPPHQRLQAGEIITTGTVTSAFSVQAGQTWTTELAGIGLPGLSVHLTD